jgi:hypothetical protein
MHGKFLRLLFLQAHQKTEAHFTATDDDVLYLFVQKQKSAQRYIPQGYFPPYEAV